MQSVSRDEIISIVSEVESSHGFREWIDNEPVLIQTMIEYDNTRPVDLIDTILMLYIGIQIGRHQVLEEKLGELEL